jgi:hypothetical protein
MSPARGAPPKRTPKHSKPRKRQKAGPKTGELVRQVHGGSIWRGTPANIVPGPGRPKDEVRQKYLRVSEKAADFLDSLFDGRVEIQLVGTCPECGHEGASPAPLELVRAVTAQISKSVDVRLRAVDPAARYGLGTQDEVDIVNHPRTLAFVSAFQQALTILPVDQAEKVAARVHEILTDGSV